MTNWPNLTADERAAARAGRDSYTLKEKMNNCLYDALALLKGNDAAREIAWKLPWGNYLVNTAEEIAAYCKTKAAQELGESVEGICPVCGASVEYTGEDIKTCGGGMHPWKCPACGATGEEGYNEVFDGQQYNVKDKDGNEIPT